MRVRLFDTLGEALRAQRELDATYSLPREHVEGAGPTDYQLARPGHAAARIRAMGVRTEHFVPIIVHPDGSPFALIDPEADDAIPLTPDWFAPPARRQDE